MDSVDSNVGSDHLAEFLQSKAASTSKHSETSAAYHRSGTPDSDTNFNVSQKFIFTFIQTQHAIQARLQKSALPIVGKKKQRVVDSPTKHDQSADHKRGSRTPVVIRDTGMNSKGI